MVLLLAEIYIDSNDFRISDSESIISNYDKTGVKDLKTKLFGSYQFRIRSIEIYQIGFKK